MKKWDTDQVAHILMLSNRDSRYWHHQRLQIHFCEIVPVLNERFRSHVLVQAKLLFLKIKKYNRTLYDIIEQHIFLMILEFLKIKKFQSVVIIDCYI
jgi:hypothetical protein